MLLSSFLNDGEELHVVLSAPRNSINERLLHSSVQVTITYHELGPAPLQDGGLQLSNAGCQCNWSEVDGQVGVRLSIMFAKQTYDPHLPS